MLAVETSEAAGLSPDGDPLPARNRIRAALLTFGVGVVVELAVVASLVIGAQFLGPVRDSNPATSLALEPPKIALPPAPRAFLPEPRSLGGYLVADPALLEDSPNGPLPVVAADRRAPMSAYAQSVMANDKRPRVAVIIRGLTVSASSTKLALARLPQPVTLAFVPFAFDAQASVDLAREAGHEVLLEVPMEPFDFPESDPGPHALMTAASSEENLKRLSWSLSRFTGYVGVTNLLGARFMSEQAGFEPVLSEIARRGLIFVDTGASQRSLAKTTARQTRASLATGTLLLDETQSRQAIDTKLGELESEARRSGFAIGVGSAFPATIARVAAWAESLDQRGLVLVPISSLAKPIEQEQVTQPVSPSPAAERRASLASDGATKARPH